MTATPGDRLAAGARVAAGRGRRVDAGRGLAVLGAALLPLGLVTLGLGWYGVAHTPHLNEQLAYLASGGLLGLGLVVTGATLYVCGWLTEIVRQGERQLAAQRELAERSAAALSDSATTGPPPLVTAGRGRTVHRSDCPTIGTAERHPVSTPPPGAPRCRVCRPGPAQTGGGPEPSR